MQVFTFGHLGMFLSQVRRISLFTEVTTAMSFMGVNIVRGFRKFNSNEAIIGIRDTTCSTEAQIISRVVIYFATELGMIERLPTV